MQLVKEVRQYQIDLGQAFPYKEMVKEWTGALVHISEYEPKHPQLDPPYHKADAIALKNTRSQDFQQPTVVNGASSIFWWTRDDNC